MNKSKIKLLIIVFVVGLAAIIIGKVASKIAHKNEVEQKISAIPKFSFETLDGKYFSDKDLRKKRNEYNLYLF